MQNTNHLFVYGSLRSDAPNSMRRLLGDSVQIGPASAQGRLYVVEGFPALRLSDHPDEIVVGELYELPGESAGVILEILDIYEGIDKDAQQPVYRREVIEVSVGSGSLNAWAYLLNAGEDDLERIVPGDYVEWLTG